MWRSRVLALSLGLCAALTLTGRAAPPSKKPAKSTGEAAGTQGPVLVVVNGQKVTEGELNRLFSTRQVAEEKREKYRRRFLDELIDMRLLQQYLASRKTTASKQEVDEQIRRIRETARQRGADPDKALAAVGYTTESLREEVSLPLAWKHYVDRVIPPEKLKAYFNAHREEFDGTKVRASRILIKVPPGDDDAFQAAEAKLKTLRKRILSGEISFADAARAESAAPSAEEGGDVGEFPYSGKMFKQFSQEAFQLKTGEISQPFRTKYGVELCLVTDRVPGELSLEDVRDEVLTRMSDELLKQTREELRKTAKIEWKSEQP